MASQSAQVVPLVLSLSLSLFQPPPPLPESVCEVSEALQSCAVWGFVGRAKFKVAFQDLRLKKRTYKQSSRRGIAIEARDASEQTKGQQWHTSVSSSSPRCDPPSLRVRMQPCGASYDAPIERAWPLSVECSPCHGEHLRLCAAEAGGLPGSDQK